MNDRDDDHGPMDADAIGAAAAMEAIKQTAAGSKGPAGGFLGRAGGSSSPKPGKAAKGEDSDDETAARGGSSGGMQDKLVRDVIVSWCPGCADRNTDIPCDVSGGQVVRQEEHRIEWWERVPGQGTRCVPFCSDGGRCSQCGLQRCKRPLRLQ